MTNDPHGNRESLAGKLRSSRMRMGMTQQQVADFVGIARSAVSEIETSYRDVSASELAAFSRLFGEPVQRLLARPSGDTALERLVLRSAELASAGRDALRRFVDTCAAYQDLEEKLATSRVADLRAVETPLHRLEHAEQLADQERRRVDLGVTPGRQLLDVLEETLGVKVVAFEMESALSGASVRDEYFGAAILLNRAHSPGRQVFTLAHEYFHLLTHGRVAGATGGDETTAHVNDVVERSEKTKVEEFADHFAGHLLLPREHLLQCVQRIARDDGLVNTLDIVGMARYFGVSVQAVFRRLSVLGVISRETADAAYSDLA